MGGRDPDQQQPVGRDGRAPLLIREDGEQEPFVRAEVAGIGVVDVKTTTSAVGDDAEELVECRIRLRHADEHEGGAQRLVQSGAGTIGLTQRRNAQIEN